MDHPNSFTTHPLQYLRHLPAFMRTLASIGLVLTLAACKPPPRQAQAPATIALNTDPNPYPSHEFNAEDATPPTNPPPTASQLEHQAASLGLLHAQITQLQSERNLSRSFDRANAAITEQNRDPIAPNRIAINTATFDQLQQLPRIGPALAHRIIAARPFRSTNALLSVNGIGPATFAQLEPLITLDHAIHHNAEHPRNPGDHVEPTRSER